MVTNKEQINVLINKYKKYVEIILNASPDVIEKLSSLNDEDAFSYLKQLKNGKDKEENALILNLKKDGTKYYFDI